MKAHQWIPRTDTPDIKEWKLIPMPIVTTVTIQSRTGRLCGIEREVCSIWDRYTLAKKKKFRRIRRIPSHRVSALSAFGIEQGNYFNSKSNLWCNPIKGHSPAPFNFFCQSVEWIPSCCWISPHKQFLRDTHRDVYNNLIIMKGLVNFPQDFNVTLRDVSQFCFYSSTNSSCPDRLLHDSCREKLRKSHSSWGNFEQRVGSSTLNVKGGLRVSMRPLEPLL